MEEEGEEEGEHGPQPVDVEQEAQAQRQVHPRLRHGLVAAEEVQNGPEHDQRRSREQREDGQRRAERRPLVVAVVSDVGQGEHGRKRRVAVLQVSSAAHALDAQVVQAGLPSDASLPVRDVGQGGVVQEQVFGAAGEATGGIGACYLG